MEKSRAVISEIIREQVYRHPSFTQTVCLEQVSSKVSGIMYQRINYKIRSINRTIIPTITSHSK